jgi:hypothetical protein
MDLQKKVVWVNYYEHAACMYPSKHMADMHADSDRIGCIRVDLEARFDEELIPTEPGALVGLTIRLKEDKFYHWMVMADKRCYPSLPTTRHPLIVCNPDVPFSFVSLDDILDVLP